MRIDKDNHRRDPQTTLQPSREEQTITTETRGRRLILGNPRVTSGPTTAQTSSPTDRGFRLGTKSNVSVAPSVSKTTVQPWIIMVAGGALVLLVVALLLRPATASSAEGLANERLVNQYTKYIETKGSVDAAQIAERRKDVVSRLQAVAWAKAIDDRAALEKELTALLFLDDDKSSPLYQYSVAQLKQLGPPKKRGAGL